MKKAAYSLFILLCFSCCNAKIHKDRKVVIDSIFNRMEIGGVDTKSPLLYGYFFLDKDKSHLEALKNELLKDGYKLVRLEATSEKNFILHVEKVEIQSRVSLLERENELDHLSQTFHVQTYDGWDVGNSDPAKPLTSQNSAFEKSLENKNDVELYQLASQFYDAQTNDKAIIVFEKCIQNNYKDDTCYYKQGVSYIGLGNSKKGIEKLEQAIKINPNYFKAYFNLGAICYDIHEYERSVDFYQKAAKLDPNDDKVYYGIAASLFVLGQVKDGQTNCERALKLNPQNEMAIALLSQLKAKSNP